MSAFRILLEGYMFAKTENQKEMYVHYLHLTNPYLCVEDSGHSETIRMLNEKNKKAGS